VTKALLSRRFAAAGPDRINGKPVVVEELEVTSIAEETRPPFRHPFENPVSRIPPTRTSTQERTLRRLEKPSDLELEGSRKGP